MTAQTQEHFMYRMSRLLIAEENLNNEIRNTPASRKMQRVRQRMLEHLREVGRGGDLSLIVATEKAIVQGDLDHYANSQAMSASLKTALDEIAAIERLLGIVDDAEQYRAIDHAHSLKKNREYGLPLDEARQGLKSHYARLGNLDKSRLDDDEKHLIEARKSAFTQAQKLHAERQTGTLAALVALTELQP